MQASVIKLDLPQHTVYHIKQHGKRTTILNALEDVGLLDLSVIIGNDNEYPTMHYLNSLTYSVSDSL